MIEFGVYSLLFLGSCLVIHKAFRSWQPGPEEDERW
jgi:hypothetical protein